MGLGGEQGRLWEWVGGTLEVLVHGTWVLVDDMWVQVDDRWVQVGGTLVQVDGMWVLVGDILVLVGCTGLEERLAARFQTM